MEKTRKAKAYKESFVILSYVPKEDLLKIPKTVLEKISNNMDKNYDYKIKPGKDFDDAEMLPETKALLALIFRNYWANEEQKELIERKRRLDSESLEAEKRKKYNPDNIFKNRTNSLNKFSNVENECMAMVEIKEKNILQKIFDKIKKLFRRR